MKSQDYRAGYRDGYRTAMLEFNEANRKVLEETLHKGRKHLAGLTKGTE